MFLHSRFSQTFHFLFFHDLSLKRNELQTLFIHGTLELKKLMPFQLQLYIYFIILFFIKAMLEIKNPGCSFLLCLLFFDSLSCLVSPIFYLFINIFLKYSPFWLWERQIQREMLDFFSLLLWENNWHTVVRPRAHWVIRAISSRSLLETKDDGGKKQKKQNKPSHNQADEPVWSGTSRNTTKNPKGEYTP